MNPEEINNEANPVPSHEISSVRREGLEDYLKNVASNLSRGIRSESRSVIVEQLHSVSDKLDNFAKVLSETAVRLRETGSSTIADMVKAGSEGMECVSSDIRDSSAKGLIGQVEKFGRNRPGIFLGITVAAGLFLWRLTSPGRVKIARETNGEEISSMESTHGVTGEEHYERH